MKHAKRSLLLPILALCSVVAVVSACYLGQAFSAFATDEPQLELTQTNAITEQDANETITNSYEAAAKIHFSTSDLLFGTIEKDEVEHSFMPATDLYHIFVADSKITEENIYGDVDESESEVFIYTSYKSGSDTHCDTVHINIPPFRTVDNLIFNGTGQNVVDITIALSNSYQIRFDANGGSFNYGPELTYLLIDQIEGSYLILPDAMLLKPPTDGNWRFAGWYTDRYFGEQVFAGMQTPPWGTYFVLYAHGLPVYGPDQEINIQFRTDSFFKNFDYVLYIPDDEPKLLDNGYTNYLNLSDVFDKIGDADNYRLNASSIYKFGYDTPAEPFFDSNGNNNSGINRSDRGAYLELTWSNIVEDNGIYSCALSIYPDENEHINWSSLNGQIIPEFSLIDGLRTFNDVVISTAWNTPGYIAVASDNGSFFKCTVSYYGFGSDPIVKDFRSDYVPIFVDKNEHVTYSYGALYTGGFYSGAGLLGAGNNNNQAGFSEQKGIPLTIIVAGLNHTRVYTFQDSLFSLVDGFEINSYIKGVSLDDTDLSAAMYTHNLENGIHTFTLKMSDKSFDTKVTYDANGGAFADGSTSMTVDATYGESLPAVETPALANYDFAGWYTEKEGGFKVDTADFHWMPWQREGVTLYAHGAEKPVPPVPPEPVPPTPDPVNPDVPGGGGSAQTGDDMGMAFALFAIIAMVGACGLVTRKLYIK